MIISVQKVGDNAQYIGHMTQVAEFTGITATTIQRWYRDGHELHIKDGFIFNFKVVKL